MSVIEFARLVGSVESVTVNVCIVLLIADGVPVISPVDVSKVRGAGSTGVTDQV